MLIAMTAGKFVATLQKQRRMNGVDALGRLAPSACSIGMTKVIWRIQSLLALLMHSF